MPDEIKELKSLRLLIVSDNQLSKQEKIKIQENLPKCLIQDENSLYYLQNLPKKDEVIFALDWGHMQLSELPSHFGKFTDLRWLYLHYNNLEKLPFDIGKLIHLQELILSYNKISELPREIGKLARLRHLNLGCNSLYSIPREIGNLKDLIFLNLEENPITKLPIEMSRQTNLEYLDLEWTNLDNQEKAKIKKLLPHCKIIFNTNQDF